ncbi:MAG: hypothetical protein WCK51_04280 [Armatimonadota bacterium]
MSKNKLGLLLLIGLIVVGCSAKEEEAPAVSAAPAASAAAPTPEATQTTTPAGGVGGQADASNGGMVELPAGGMQRG